MVARPWESGDVGDRIFVAAEIGRVRQPFLQNLVKPFHFGLIARHRIGMILVLGREQLEVRELTEHRPDIGQLKHQPLQHFVFLRHVLGQEFSGLLGKIHQDRARFEHGVRLAAGAFVIDDRRNFRVRIDLDEIRIVLLALPYIDEMLFVRQLGLFEHEVDFLNVGTGQRIKVDHGNILDFRFERFAKAAKLPVSNEADKACRGELARHRDHLCESVNRA